MYGRTRDRGREGGMDRWTNDWQSRRRMGSRFHGWREGGPAMNLSIGWRSGSAISGEGGGWREGGRQDVWLTEGILLRVLSGQPSLLKQTILSVRAAFPAALSRTCLMLVSLIQLPDKTPRKAFLFLHTSPSTPLSPPSLSLAPLPSLSLPSTP